MASAGFVAPVARRARRPLVATVLYSTKEQIADLQTTTQEDLSAQQLDIDIADINDEEDLSSIVTLQSSATAGDETASMDVMLPPPSAPQGALALWKRRLITREDPFSIHKISSIAYTISSIIILGTAALRHLDSPEAYSIIPQYLELPTYVFFISNLIMCAASVRMAFLHRKFDLTARNAFLGVAASSLFSGWFYLWTTPFDAAEIFNNQLASQFCFAVVVLLNTYFVIDTLSKVPEVVESRRDRKAQDYKGRFWVDAFGYVFPLTFALPVILATAFLYGVLYDRPWFFDQCQHIDEVRGYPGMAANLCYLQAGGSVAASFGALFPTLRDKKLISKNVELGGISLFAIPTTIWTILPSAAFLGFLLRGDVVNQSFN